MLSLHQQLKLGLKLTPQQVQYLKLLQLPSLSLEQRVKLELEQNPMLEVAEDLEPVQEEVEAGKEESDGETDKDVEKQEERKEDEGYTLEDYISDDNAGHKSPESLPQNGEEEYESPLPASVPLTERLLTQFRMLDVEAEEELIAEEILGNVDEDGYLRRDLALIVQDLNLTYNLTLSVERAEAVLHKILNLDPPGVAARTLPECLAAQLRCTNAPPALRELAYRVVTQHFDDFRQKRFDILVTDLMMPKMMGDELARRLRHEEPAIKVLYLTGFSDRLFKDKTTLWEDEAFLDKPCTVKGLLQAVALLNSGRLEAKDVSD